MKLHEIAAAVDKATDAVKASEKLPVPILAAKARKAAQSHPEDIGLITASQVLTKMANNQMFITRADFNRVYEKLHTPHTKLAELFSEELGRKPLQGPQVFHRASNESVSLDRDYERVADPLLTNALKAAFDGSNEDKLYSPVDAKKAQRSCLAELVALGVEPKRIDTFAGRNDLIFCKAVYETPNGQSHVLVPIELRQDKALLPTMFLSQNGFADLNKEALEDHIKTTAGQSYRVDGEKLIEVLSTAKNGIKKIASDVELAAMKIKAERDAPPHDPNSILYTKIDDPTQSELELPEVCQDPEQISFAERLNSPGGIAKFIHSDRVVESGRSMLVRKMGELGYRNAQVRVADVEDNSIIFAVAIGTNTGFKVPVKVHDNMVIPPTIFIADGELGALSKRSIDELVKAGTTDKKMLSKASPMYGLKPSELVQIVKDSVNEGNLPKAEDAIKVLGGIDRQAERVAIAILMQAISETGKDPAKEHEEMTRVANQPVNDVPQMMTYKVFFPEGA
jgi:hypothetical protein